MPWAPANLASTFLTPGQAEEVLAAIGSALDHAELTIGELTEAVVAACGSWAGDLVVPGFDGMWPRWRQALPLAGARGVLCFGRPRGRMVTYASPRTWLPGFEPAAGPDALGWLVRQFLAAYGPATPAQFAQWAGTPRRWAGELFAELADGLQEAELDGQAAWLPAGQLNRPAGPQGLRLLPYFDPYVIGCHPRSRLFPAAAGRALNRTGQAGTRPVLLIDGVAGSIWHQRKAGRFLDITVEPFGELTAAQHRELASQAARLGEFLGCAPRLTLATVPTRSHL
jgi:hypothetical protein